MIERSEILRRFEQWLDRTLEQEAPPAGIPSEILEGDESGDPPTDLYTLWAAMTALTQEVKLQGRAFKQLTETLARDSETRSRKEVLDGLLDLRERLARGLEPLEAMEDPQRGFWDRIFRRRWREVEHSREMVRAMEKGYRLVLESLDEMLDRFHVRPIRCAGEPFDPRRMSAVDIAETSDAAEGTVLSVYRMGYEWNGEVYRPAQVRVARRPRGAVINE